jgi:HEAT repeat protein
MRCVLICVGLIGFFLSGCGQSSAPLAGGKPIAHWLQALHDPDVKVRKNAVIKLGNVGTSDPAVLPALTSALKDVDANVRCEAILALVKSGPAASETILALAEMKRKDPNLKVRTYAAQALEKIQAGK